MLSCSGRVSGSAAILAMSAGYLGGGTLGDALFKRSRRGRVLLAAVGVVMGALFLALAVFAVVVLLALLGAVLYYAIARPRLRAAHGTGGSSALAGH